MRKQSLLQFFGTIASRAFCTLLTFLIGVVTAWLSGQTGLGNLYLLIGGASLTGAFLTFGHPSNLTKIRRESPEASDAMLAGIIAVVTMSTLALLAALYLFEFSLGASILNPPSLLYHCVITGMGVAILKCFSGDLKGLKRSELAIFVEFGLANLLYIGTLCCMHFFKYTNVKMHLSSEMVMRAYMLSTLAAVVIALFTSGHLLSLKHSRLGLRITGPKWAFWGNSMLNMVFMASPIFVAAWLGGVETSATVGVVQRIVGIAGSIRVSLAAYFVPRFVLVDGEPPEGRFNEYNRSRWAMTIAFLPVLIVSMLCGRMFTSIFQLGEDISVVLAATASLRFLDALTGAPQQFLEMNGLGKLEFRLGLMSIAVYIMCLLLLALLFSPELAICISVSAGIASRSLGGWAAIRRIRNAGGKVSSEVARVPPTSEELK
ncbi:hypothetical protein [Neorhodopirellula pilleata]|uniref:Polysaccharide biosynthesis protein n=1 Tax=Neorhodopirellula pilleata TaxID=2714738 RepID=A0A5C5ZPX0_9BACT|nr:hypothetical protein [Neorhodopirellula pilleata]TWT89280.1 hypothetical protein Pla100_55970 [Neorhodopirellula pilleata]